MATVLRAPRRLLRLVFGAPARFLGRRPLLLWATVALVAAGVAYGGQRSLIWMETPSFCGRCHTMGLEVTAHERSAHAKVECAECHVGEGLPGLVKAKWDGLGQVIKLVTGRYARPVPPAAHKMPSASETCGRCHDPATAGGDLLVTRSYFLSDQSNTEQRVALVVRGSPASAPETPGIHWHVLAKVEYAAEDPEARVIDWIGVRYPDGTRKEFISQNTVQISEQAGQRAGELSRGSHVRRMSCYDCHNRVGHDLLTPNRALDAALADGRIDRGLPFIKQQGLEVLSGTYGSIADADRAIDGLAQTYHRDFPDVFLERPKQLQQSLAVLTQLYNETASPAMREFPSTYPSYLGHTDSAGCFRCHDGGHYLIKDGRLSNEPIPSRCSLCHTFPSVGQQTPNVMLGPPPPSHDDRLWVFTHKNATSSLTPAGTVCAGCHSKTYCSNCHTTGAVGVKHDNMLFNHAEVVREVTDRPCAYCHQKPFCARCHEKKPPP